MATEKCRCRECDNKYSITHRSEDVAEFCPFCGERNLDDEDANSDLDEDEF